MKTYAVIGLGKFGFHIAKGLAEQGMDIIAIDNDPHKIQVISEYIEDAIILDSTDIKALQEAGVVGLDTVIISIGENIEASILTLMALKELENKTIIAKAITLTHGEILARLGAFKVIYPERESAKKLVENLVGNVVIDQVDFSSTIKIAKFSVTQSLIGKQVKDIEAMFENEIHLIACKTRDNWTFDVEKTYKIRENDMLAFIGKKAFIEKLRNLTKSEN
ncbi:MAG: TrkA family potassium uptake protein [Sulfurospirillum sp.]|jgi:trk system potassium uptake protein TrkA|uniref:potassium channel family protein n=1 Tax=Sulfurospirillum sp. UCH001 TaxID=1581011 RepID=UPI0008315994|nr:MULTISPECIES: TrkA family potassium uptake protein [unclassified Sulfurospirillum]WNY99201.1 Ktr system potassium uptake protein C (K(+)-uptake protein KtrC) (ORF4) [Sulfurospirillum sp. 'SP']